jgi:hypothetical protein
MAFCPTGTIVNFLPVLIYRFVILSESAVLWCINYTACTTVILASFGTMKLQTLQEVKNISMFAPKYLAIVRRA